MVTGKMEALICDGFFSPVKVTIAKSTYRDSEGLPHWIQSVLYKFCLVTNGKPKNKYIQTWSEIMAMK